MSKLETSALVAAGVGLAAWWLSRALRPRSEYDFRGKVVLITGGSRGLGLVLARRLAEQGAQLAVCARDADELRRAADDLARCGAEPLARPCDVTDAAAVRDLVRAVEERFGRIDVLVNNASIIQVGPLDDMTRQDFEQALQITFWGAYNAVEAVLPGMRRRRGGRIVNISSIGGKVGVPHLLPYVVSKFALTGYSQGLRAELARDGIVVTSICPGLMRTGSPRHALFKGHHDEEYAWFSVGDSVPGLTISAEEAADHIIEACRRGEAEKVLSLPAQAAVTVQSLFPQLVAGLTEMAARLLPGPAGDTRSLEGKDCTGLVPSWLVALSDWAARQNNEIAPSEQAAGRRGA
jgi:NAD(P)-dependent dehydrogenase (short-subunit alcohol dehydrogenase family)